MNIYEIDREIMSLVDPETGELADVEAFENLQMERERKVDNVIAWYKDTKALVEAMKAEKDNLSKRIATEEARLKRIGEYATYATGGQSYKSAVGAVSFRTSTSVEVDDDFIEWATKNAPDLVNVVTDVKPNKTAIKEAMAEGKEFPAARLITKQNISIK